MSRNNKEYLAFTAKSQTQFNNIQELKLPKAKIKKPFYEAMLLRYRDYTVSLTPSPHMLMKEKQALC